MPDAITWTDRLWNLHHALGRPPTLDEMLMAAEIHTLTDDEKAEQRKSWARSLVPCEHGTLDWEQCPGCRGGNDA